MIDSVTIEKAVAEYRQACDRRGRDPTFAGLALMLGVCPNTVRHVSAGYYQTNRPYTNRPDVKRCIANEDFSIIQGIFGGDKI